MNNDFNAFMEQMWQCAILLGEGMILLTVALVVFVIINAYIEGGDKKDKESGLRNDTFNDTFKDPDNKDPDESYLEDPWKSDEERK